VGNAINDFIMRAKLFLPKSKDLLCKDIIARCGIEQLLSALETIIQFDHIYDPKKSLPRYESIVEQMIERVIALIKSDEREYCLSRISEKRAKLLIIISGRCRDCYDHGEQQYNGLKVRALLWAVGTHQSVPAMAELEKCYEKIYEKPKTLAMTSCCASFRLFKKAHRQRFSCALAETDPIVQRQQLLQQLCCRGPKSGSTLTQYVILALGLEGYNMIVPPLQKAAREALSYMDQLSSCEQVAAFKRSSS
jgi:hypothetical protein